MKLLVTGATGFLGENFVRQLQSEYELVALVRDSSNIDSLKNLNCNIQKYKAESEIFEVFEHHDFDGVVHFASSVCVDHEYEDIKVLIDSNIYFGTLLLEASVTTKVKWFINTGTVWQSYLNEPYNPVNLYAATKEAFENIAKYYTETSNLIFTTLRLNDTFGPNDSRDKIFNLWISNAQTGEPLKMSPGEQIIDISYIDDIVNAFDALIKELSEENAVLLKNATFTVANKEKVSLRELASIFEQATNLKLNIEWGGRAYREREIMGTYNVEQAVPGWQQKYSLEEAIKKTVESKNVQKEN